MNRLLASMIVLVTAVPIVAGAQTPPVSQGMANGAFSDVSLKGRWGVKVYSNRFLDISPREFGRCTSHPSLPLVFCGSVDGAFRALHKDNGEIIWTLKTSAAVRTAPAVFKDRVFLAAADGCLHCLDPETGKAVWDQPYCVDNPIWGGPVVTDEMVYFSVLGNQVYAVGTSDGKFRFKIQRDRPRMMSSEGISDPTVVGDTLLSAFSDGVLVAASRHTGRELWHQDLAGDTKGPADVDATPVVADGIVFSGAFAAGPVALDASDGTVVWKGRRFGVDRPVIFRDFVIVADADGFVIALDRKNGSEVWITRLDTPAAWNPVLVNGLLIVGGDRGLWVLRPTDGRVLLRTVLPFGVTTEPGVDGSDLYFPAPGGTINKASLTR